jgi:hypothetical protein
MNWRRAGPDSYFLEYLLRITEIPHPRSLKFPTLNGAVGPLKGPPIVWRAPRCWR